MNPIALTTHHPARASHIAKEPPAILPKAAHQAIDGTIPVAVTRAKPIPPATPRRPTLNLAALPAAPILHFSAMMIHQVSSI